VQIVALAGGWHMPRWNALLDCGSVVVLALALIIPDECGFRFAASRDDIRDELWRRCDLPWGHWARRGSRRHQGPLL
jgi:hypothetical protein